MCLSKSGRARQRKNRAAPVQFALADNPTRIPVLIVGMPRTGTTLVEQVLATHPNVIGAGELEGAAVAAEDDISRRQCGWLADHAKYLEGLDRINRHHRRVRSQLPRHPDC